MAKERTKKHYEIGFEKASEQMRATANSIAMGTYDKTKPEEQIRVLKRTVIEQRANMTEDNEKYQKQFNCPEHIEYKHFIAKSEEVLEELDHSPTIQADNKLEDLLGDN